MPADSARSSSTASATIMRRRSGPARSPPARLPWPPIMVSHGLKAWSGIGPAKGLLTLWAQTRCTAENAQRKARRRRRARCPASLRNAALGVFGSNPKGTGGRGRHSLLLSSPRLLVLVSSAAAIGAPCHPFAFAFIALAGPNALRQPRRRLGRRSAAVYQRPARGPRTRRWPGNSGALSAPIRG